MQNKKNTPCSFFQKGDCRKGDQCLFKHEVSKSNLQISSNPNIYNKLVKNFSKPNICKYFLSEKGCTNPNCTFMHHYNNDLYHVKRIPIHQTNIVACCPLCNII